MKRLTNTAILVNLFLLCMSSFSQNILENEWINNEQIYYKLKVSTKGLFKITHQELLSAGLDLSSVNPQNLQLFHHGKEMSIKVIGEADGVFDTEDYVLFYAKPNDGSQDSLVYRPASARMNKYYSIYSDNTFYYLTIGNRAGKRISLTGNPLDENAHEEQFHLQEKVLLNIQKHTFNDFVGSPSKLKQSFFVAGEGRSGNKISTLTENVDHIVLEKLFKTANAPLPTIEVNMNGRSFGYKKIQLSIKNASLRELTPFFITDFNQIIQKENLLWSDIDSTNAFSLVTKCISSEANQFSSITHIKVVFPQTFNMLGENEKAFYLPPSATQSSKLILRNINSESMAMNVSDFFDVKELPITREGNDMNVYLKRQNAKEEIFVSSNFQKVNEISVFYPQSSKNEKCNFLIITHTSLLPAAKKYADYRNSAMGGGYKVALETIDKLYDSFTYGEKNPMAIRKYLHYLAINQNLPQNLLIIGSSYSASDSIKVKENIDLVPTVGYPGSDVLLSAGLNGYGIDVQSVPTGRINAINNQQVLDYLAKVVEYEHPQQFENWQKSILHLNGGNTLYQIDYFKQVLSNNGQKVIKNDSTFFITAMAKTNPTIYENINIAEKVNAGVRMITFLGHATPIKSDMNMGFASNASLGYNNKAKYPFMYFVGCRVGDIFNYYNTIGTDWLFTPDKGSIAVLSNSYFAFQGYVEPYMDEFYKNLFIAKNHESISIGQAIQHSTKYTAATQYGKFPFQVAHLHQTILQGDPSLKIFPAPMIDVALESPKEVCIDKEITVTLIANANEAPYYFEYTINGIAGRVVSDSLGMARVMINDKKIGENIFDLISVENSKGIKNTFYSNKNIQINVTKPGLSFDKERVVDDLQTNNNTELYCLGSCRIMASILPTGSMPVFGNINAQVFVGKTVGFSEGKPYLQRHYEIEPDHNPSAATAKITLFYLQSEFDNYNEIASNSGLPFLPNNTLTDRYTKKQIRILQIHGLSDGLDNNIENYHGEKVEIVPNEEDIVWNSNEQRWEISFFVQGFSAFFLNTKLSAAPLSLELLEFTGEKVNHANKLNWSFSKASRLAYVGLERSKINNFNNQLSFENIAHFQGDKLTNNSPSYLDLAITSFNDYYYRLKMVDINNKITYSKIIKMEKEKSRNVGLVFKNPISDNDEIKIYTNCKALKIIDLTGKTVKEFVIDGKPIVLNGIKQGSYVLQIIQTEGDVIFKKISKI